MVERADVGDLLLRDARALAGVGVFTWEDRTYTALRLSWFGPDAAAAGGGRACGVGAVDGGALPAPRRRG